MLKTGPTSKAKVRVQLKLECGLNLGFHGNLITLEKGKVCGLDLLIHQGLIHSHIGYKHKVTFSLAV